jgi:ATP-dependent Lon protease
MSNESATIGLFPLGLVLLPDEIVPLHIFEERYKRLINECRQLESEFGIIYAEEDQVASVGCAATITAVIDEMPDGRMNIMVRGVRRFRLAAVHEPVDAEAEYLLAEVEYFDDEDEGTDEHRQAAGAAYLELLAVMGVPEPEIPVGEAPLSFRLAGSVDFGTDVKQNLIESVSEDERLMELTAAFVDLIPKAEEQRKRTEAIRGNGKGI